MNILLWILQIVLALHTFMGAIWKFSKTAEQTMPSLKAIPLGIWRGMSVLEILAGLGLIVPFFVPSLALLAPIGALIIALEMLLFTALHLLSGANKHGPIGYWMVMAAFCLFVSYGRFVLSPL